MVVDFPGPVAAEISEDLALLDPEADSGKSLNVCLFVSLLKVVHLDKPVDRSPLEPCHASGARGQLSLVVPVHGVARPPPSSTTRSAGAGAGRHLPDRQ